VLDESLTGSTTAWAERLCSSVLKFPHMSALIVGFNTQGMRPSDFDMRLSATISGCWYPHGSLRFDRTTA
jgi:hypothetical protein